MALPGPGIQSDKIRGDLSTLISRSNQIEETNRQMAEEMATLRKRNDELEKESEQFEIFRPILENPPTRLEVCIRDKRVAMELEARTKKLYGKLAGDDGSKDADQRRRWRINLDIVALACIKTGLASWDRTFARHIARATGTR